MQLPDGYRIRFKREARAVAFRESHWKVMTNDILPKARAQLEAAMLAYCEHGPDNIPPQKFRFECHYDLGGKKVRVEAFKTRHVRVYGAVTAVDGCPTFLVTEMDIAKKTDRADPDKLAAAGKAAHRIIHAAPKTKTGR